VREPRRARFLLPVIVFLVFFPAVAGAEPDGLSNVRAGGYLKTLDLYLQSAPDISASDGWLSANRMRFDLTGEMAADYDFEFSAENVFLYNDPAGLLILPGTSVNRALNLEKTWNSGGHFQDEVFIDRLNLKRSVSDTDFTLGRQAIGFGRIVLFSPLDVIAPFPPDALDTDVRPGVDAFRAVHYFGLGGQVGGVAVFGNQRQNDSFLGTFSFNLSGVDLLAMTGWLRGRPMGGLGLAGSLSGLGLKGEIAAYGGKDVGDPGGDLQDRFAIGAVEGWYRFDNGLVFLGEYLYNGAGGDSPEDYHRVAASAPYQEGLTFLLGRHYLLAGPSYEVHPLVTLEALLIWNLADSSFLLRPLADISLSDDLVLQLFWSWTQGRKPQINPGQALSVPESEFGLAGDSGGLLLKYFF
jgi:hypothetical protein